MAHHHDFWLQHCSSIPLLCSPGKRYFGPEYTTVRLSNAMHQVTPLGSEGLFIMQHPSKYDFLNSKNWMVFCQFLQPLLTHRAFTCNLNNAEEKLEHGRQCFLAESCLLDLEFKRQRAHTHFPRQNTAITSWGMQTGRSLLISVDWQQLSTCWSISWFKVPMINLTSSSYPEDALRQNNRILFSKGKHTIVLMHSTAEAMITHAQNDVFKRKGNQL